MKKERLKWLHAPGHAGSQNKAVINFATSTGAVLIDWSEMYWNVDELRATATNYQHFVGKPVKVDVRGRVVNHDVILSVHEDAKIVHKEEFFLAPAVPVNIKYMPERHGKAMVFDYDDIRVLALAWHPQPRPLRWLKLVLPGYRRSVRRVQQKQRELTAKYDPDLILNGGDLQLGVGKAWFYPNQMAERLGMNWRRHRIDWQMWKGQGWKMVKRRNLDPSKVNPKMDHTWSLLTLGRDTQ